MPLADAKDYVIGKEKKVKERSIRPPWSGYWFVNVGEDQCRNWDDNRKYSFVGAGGGAWYSEPLKRLAIGDRIFAYMKGLGYVGFGEVVHNAVSIDKFLLPESDQRLIDAPLQAQDPTHHLDDKDMWEHVVGVRWIKTFPREEAKTFTGVFANQNIVCKLSHLDTVEFLKRTFDLD